MSSENTLPTVAQRAKLTTICANLGIAVPHVSTRYEASAAIRRLAPRPFVDPHGQRLADARQARKAGA